MTAVSEFICSLSNASGRIPCWETSGSAARAELPYNFEPTGCVCDRNYLRWEQLPTTDGNNFFIEISVGERLLWVRLGDVRIASMDVEDEDYDRFVGAPSTYSNSTTFPLSSASAAPASDTLARSWGGASSRISFAPEANESESVAYIAHAQAVASELVVALFSLDRRMPLWLTVDSALRDEPTASSAPSGHICASMAERHCKLKGAPNGECFWYMEVCIGDWSRRNVWVRQAHVRLYQADAADLEEDLAPDAADW